ncbi:MAG TPA: hypothetical protein VJI75_05495 [Candidatus Nanoarchaeia archaeon]|nr:hypothetical protein [Candidatus Nanoarchaeia archaeon]
MTSTKQTNDGNNSAVKLRSYFPGGRMQFYGVVALVFGLPLSIVIMADNAYKKCAYYNHEVIARLQKEEAENKELRALERRLDKNGDGIVRMNELPNFLDTLEVRIHNKEYMEFGHNTIYIPAHTVKQYPK